MTSSEKNHDTGLRILEVLKILLNENVSKNDIIERLRKNKSIENVYTPEAFIKYFNTLKVLGLCIKKEKLQYHLENALFKTQLTNNEEKILISLINNILSFNSDTEEKILKSFFLKLDKYIDINLEEKINKIELSEQNSFNENIKDNIINSLKKMQQDNLKIQMTYKKSQKLSETVTTELKEIFSAENNPYIICYNSELGRNKKIYIDDIICVKQLPSKSSGRNYLNSVVFEVYGRLAALYKLKPSEHVIDFSSTHLTISNTEEDKDTLLLRLLKYGENCKIIRPKYMKDEFLSLTESILENLEAI